MYKIYIEVDDKNRITKIFSDLFEAPSNESIFIEEGYGDKFVHAHLYLEKSVSDFAYNYKYVNGEILERTEEEKNEDIVVTEPTPTPIEIANSKIEALEEELLITNQYLTDLELLVYESILD